MGTSLDGNKILNRENKKHNKVYTSYCIMLFSCLDEV